jgi:two-component system, sensor histidine kinase and response regulator
MSRTPSTPPPRPPLARHLASAGLVAVLWLVRIPVEAWVGAGSSPVLFVPTVVLASRFRGFGAGVVAVLFWARSWVCLDIPPGGSETIRRPDDQYRAAVFLLEGLILAGVVEALDAALRASDETGRQMGRYREVSGRDEARLRAILEHSSAPIWMKDLEGRYLVLNRRFEALSRRPAPEVVGRTDSELSLPPIAGSLSESDRLVLESGRAVEVEEVLQLEDGPHTILSVKFPLANEGGPPYALGGSSRTSRS